MSLVSIIVPVYNTEKYLDKCVESLVLQTLRDIEIILVDDGSPDNCPKKCDDWAKKDSRIKVIHQENRGLVSARNAGIKKSASEYIGFVDSDDWVEKEMFQILYENIIKNDADIVQCGVELVHENGESENIGRKEEVVYRDNEAFKNIVKPYFQEDFYLDGLNSYLWNKVYKKDLILSILKYESTSLKMREDTLLNLLAYCFCKNKIELKDSFLYKYRIIDTSMSHKFDEKLLFQQQLFFAQAQNIAKMFNLETQGLKIREDYAYCGLIQMLISADVKVFKKSKLLKEYYNYLNNKNILLKFSEIIDFPLSLLFKLVKLKIFLIVSAGTQIIIKMRNKGC